MDLLRAEYVRQRDEAEAKSDASKKSWTPCGCIIKNFITTSHINLDYEVHWHSKIHPRLMLLLFRVVEVLPFFLIFFLVSFRCTDTITSWRRTRAHWRKVENILFLRVARRKYITWTRNPNDINRTHSDTSLSQPPKIRPFCWQPTSGCGGQATMRWYCN